MASSRRRLSRHPIDQPSVSMIVEWARLWVYRVSHCPTFSVNSLWIIGVCYRGMLVSVGQSHDFSRWSILSLGNRSINVEMICKLRVIDINWCLITLIIYVQTLKRLLGEWLIWGYGDTRLPSLRTRGPKCHTSRAEMSHKQGQNVTQGPKCHTVML